MKNLMLLMMTILLVNVSVYADSEVEERMGSRDTECHMMNELNAKVATGAGEEVVRPASSNGSNDQ